VFRDRGLGVLGFLRFRGSGFGFVSYVTEVPSIGGVTLQEPLIISTPPTPSFIYP
jgi:hypothetical protein